MHCGVVVRSLDSRLTGPMVSSQPLCCKHGPGQAAHIRVPVSEQYNLVPPPK